MTLVASVLNWNATQARCQQDTGDSQLPDISDGWSGEHARDQDTAAENVGKEDKAARSDL